VELLGFVPIHFPLGYGVLLCVKLDVLLHINYESGGN
jgi:hypothetical protein